MEGATGRCGVIDWSCALRGPLLYDLASAVMYAGGPGLAGELVRAYLSEGILGTTEIERGRAPILRFRWASCRPGPGRRAKSFWLVSGMVE